MSSAVPVGLGAHDSFEPFHSHRRSTALERAFDRPLVAERRGRPVVDKPPLGSLDKHPAQPRQRVPVCESLLAQNAGVMEPTTTYCGTARV